MELTHQPKWHPLYFLGPKRATRWNTMPHNAFQSTKFSNFVLFDLKQLVLYMDSVTNLLYPLNYSYSVTHAVKHFRIIMAFPNVTLAHNGWQWEDMIGEKNNFSKTSFLFSLKPYFSQAPLESWHLLKSKVNLNHASCQAWRLEGPGRRAGPDWAPGCLASLWTLSLGLGLLLLLLVLLQSRPAKPWFPAHFCPVDSIHVLRGSQHFRSTDIEPD